MDTKENDTYYRQIDTKEEDKTEAKQTYIDTKE
jgi:hypothetical protein